MVCMSVRALGHRFEKKPKPHLVEGYRRTVGKGTSGRRQPRTFGGPEFIVAIDDDPFAWRPVTRPRTRNRSWVWQLGTVERLGVHRDVPRTTLSPAVGPATSGACWRNRAGAMPPPPLPANERLVRSSALGNSAASFEI